MKNILIIDDDLDIGNVLEEILKNDNVINFSKEQKS